MSTPPLTPPQFQEIGEGNRSISGDITPQERTRNNLVILHDIDGLSWRKIAQLPEYDGISHIDLNRIYHGGEPASLEVRGRFGWPITAPAPVCGKCGDVHVTKRCTKKSGEPRKKPIPWEHYAQVALFNRFDAVMNDYPELEFAFAVPNGGKRHISVARKLKAEGVKAGVLDIWLPVPRQGFIGLVMELKVNGNTTTPDQERWIAFLSLEGWLAVVIDGDEMGFEIATAYLAGFSYGDGKLLMDIIAPLATPSPQISSQGSEYLEGRNWRNHEQE